MGFINSLFNTEETVSASFYAKTESKNADGTRNKGYSGDASLTVDCLFWQGSAADSVVSERLRAQISGVLAIDYEDYTATVNDTDKVVIDGATYFVVNPEDSAFQNVAVYIPVKKDN
jgi:hypothetical protein